MSSSVAFSVWNLQIHRYGIFYVISFIVGYLYLRFIIKKFKFFSLELLDDLLFVTVLGVLLGWRLWHVLIYNFNYYLNHPLQIFAIRNGGMSFVGWVIWVSIWLFYIKKKYNLNFKKLLLVSDLILLVVPLGIFLGRIGNFLNQELYGKIINITQLPTYITNIAKKLMLIHIYTNVDLNRRINTNFLEAFFEWIIIFIILNYIFWKKPTQKSWKITSLFLILYWIIRFLMEFLRDYNKTEFIWPLTKTQWIMILFIFWWFYLYYLTSSEKI